MSRSGWRTTSRPTTITASCRPRSARASKASERWRPRPVMLRMLSTQTSGDHRRRDADLPAGPGEAAPDRLQVVRDRDRRQGDHDQVVDQDRPAGDEGDQLVEGVAGEGRGAAALAEHRAALDVAERGQAEQQPGGEEDQRRQAEAAVGDDAEREVDREPDRRVGGGEQPGDAEAALDPAARLRAPPRAARAEGRSAAHVPVLELTQSRPTPTARKAIPIRKPTEAGPPPLARVTTRTRHPDRDERRPRTPRTAPR